MVRNMTTYLGCKLKTAREELGLTQPQVAEKLNVSVSTIGMYEQGRREPDLDTLIKFSDILHTSILTLLGIEEKFHIKSIHIDKVISELIDFIKNQDYVFLKDKKLTENEISNILYVLKLLLK